MPNSSPSGEWGFAADLGSRGLDGCLGRSQQRILGRKVFDGSGMQKGAGKRNPLTLSFAKLSVVG
jgi:hypothetical protein